jgi:hypothetical protein
MVLQLLAQTDGRDQTETGVVPLFFALATPEAVLAVLTSKIAARFQHRTFHAHLTSPLFATNACLWAFREGSKEDLGKTATSSVFHPVVVGFETEFEIQAGHRNSFAGRSVDRI